MQGLRILGALLLTAIVAGPSMPVSATPDMGTLIWLNSEGVWGTMPLSEFQDGFATCGASFAPVQSACTLVTTGNLGWTVGFVAPPPPAGPAGTQAALMSTSLTMTGTNGVGPLGFECNWAYVTGPLTPANIYCAITQFSGFPFGTLTTSFHAGAVDPRVLPFVGASLPSTNAVEAGVGSWEGFISAF